MTLLRSITVETWRKEQQALQPNHPNTTLHNLIVDFRIPAKKLPTGWNVYIKKHDICRRGKMKVKRALIERFYDLTDSRAQIDLNTYKVEFQSVTDIYYVLKIRYT